MEQDCSEVLILRRHSPPTQLDSAPCGTICKAVIHNERTEYYLQKSEDASKPKWELIDNY